MSALQDAAGDTLMILNGACEWCLCYMPQRRSYIDNYIHRNQATFQHKNERRTCIPQFYIITNCNTPTIAKRIRADLEATSTEGTRWTWMICNVSKYKCACVAWLWHKLIHVYVVCILYLYVYVVCMYTKFVCTLCLHVYLHMLFM